MIKIPKGVPIAYLVEDAIAEVFGIPRSANMKDRTKDEYEAKYKAKADACKTIVNKEWMIGPRLPRHSCTNLKEEYSDLVFLLNRVMGMPQGALYDGWMFYFYLRLSERNNDQLVKNHQ